MLGNHQIRFSRRRGVRVLLFRKRNVREFVLLCKVKGPICQITVQRGESFPVSVPNPHELFIAVPRGFPSGSAEQFINQHENVRQIRVNVISLADLGTPVEIPRLLAFVHTVVSRPIRHEGNKGNCFPVLLGKPFHIRKELLMRIMD